MPAKGPRSIVNVLRFSRRTLEAYTRYKPHRINIFNRRAADGEGKELLFFKDCRDHGI